MIVNVHLMWEWSPKKSFNSLSQRNRELYVFGHLVFYYRTHLSVVFF